MKTITINASSTYDVEVGTGILDQAGLRIARRLGEAPSLAVLVTDGRVDNLYGQRVRKSLEEAGFHVHSYVFQEGEGAKSMRTLTHLLEFMGKMQVTRTDLVVALGGGVTGDLAGFAAAVYLRGIRFVQIPTTLLAAVDSSVGGKTAVNLEAGKNLAGAFCQPEYVLCDCQVFSTLEQKTFADGVAESLKYGVAFDEDLFRTIAEGDMNGNWEGIVARCVHLKGKVVEEDEFDNGARQLLNFGHTIGHGIEKCSQFSVSHGQGVAIGMALISEAAEERGICPPGTTDRIAEALISWGLPVKTDFTPLELCEAAQADKKRRSDKITLVLPEEIGKCVLHTVGGDELISWMGRGGE